MENPRPEKVAVVEEVRGRLDSSAGAILTEYRGLKVSELAELRRSLRAAGGEYKIYKNTLVRFAVADLGLAELEEMLTGPTAIAFVEGDAAAVAKALRDYSRTNPNLVVKGGILGGSILSPAGASALAELPSREVLLARLAGGLAAPLQKMAGLLQALPRNFAYGLKALIDQGGGVPEPPAAEAAPEPPNEATAAEAPAAEAADGETAIEAADGETAIEAADGETAIEAADGETAIEAADGETAIEAAEAAAPRVDETSDGPAEEPGGADGGSPEAQTEASTDAETEQ